MSLVKNSTVLLAAEGLSSVFMVLTGVIMARMLGVGNFGRFTTALAFSSLWMIAADGGTGFLAARSVAQKKEAALGEIFTWRILMVAAGTLGCLLTARMFLSFQEVQRLAVLLTPALILGAMVEFFCWILKGTGHVMPSAVLQILSRGALLAFTYVALLQPSPLRALIGAYWATAFIIMIVGPWILSSYGFSMRPVRLSSGFFKETIPQIYRMGMIVLLSVAFTRLDLILVAQISGSISAGLFASAGRVVDALRLLPTVAISVVLPLFAAWHAQPERLQSHFGRWFRLFLVLAVVLATAGTVMAHPLMVFLFGPDYQAASGLLTPLLWSCVPMFLNMLMFPLLYALHEHRPLLTGIIAALAVELILIAWWLPGSGPVAAGWARLIAEIVNFSVLAAAVRKRNLLPVRDLALAPIMAVLGVAVFEFHRPVLMGLVGVLSVWMILYAATLLTFWVPLLALKFHGEPPLPRRLPKDDPRPLIIAVAPCRHAADSIPGMAQTIQNQIYPADRRRLVVLVDADDASDRSAEVARSLNVEVVERINPVIKTKGDAINEFLTRRLRHQDFDAIVVFDIDARVDPDFFERIAAYLKQGDVVVQAAAMGRSSHETSIMRISDAAQALARITQRGRMAMGFPAILSGAGMVLSRSALEQLQWNTTTGRHVSDDGEMNVRCLLKDIPVRYAPDLSIKNNVPADAESVRLQRIRWVAGYPELMVDYFGDLCRKLFSGGWRVLDLVFGMFLASAFSIFFAGGIVALGFLMPLSLFFPFLLLPTQGVAILVLFHALYYVAALKTAGMTVGWEDIKSVPMFVWMRVLSWWQGVAFSYQRGRRNPTPSTHTGEPTAEPMASSRAAL